MYDLQSHEALATWERKHDIFGWGFLGGETLGMLQRPTRELSLETFRRVLAERVADAAGIVEDGSINLIRKKKPITWRTAPATQQPVPNLIDDHVNALLAAIGVATPEEMIAFLRAHKDALPGLHVAFKAPPLPEYYQPEKEGGHMNVSVEIDRGDIWYDLPFDAKGKPIVQRRDRYPHLTLLGATGTGRRFRSRAGARPSAPGAARCTPTARSTTSTRTPTSGRASGSRSWRRRSGSRPTARRRRTC